jgi:hypothetical protein
MRASATTCSEVAISSGITPARTTNASPTRASITRPLCNAAKTITLAAINAQFTKGRLM